MREASPKRFRQQCKGLGRRLAFGAGLGAGFLCAFAPPAAAGDFSLNWGASPYTWAANSTGPVTVTMTDQYGFQMQARMTISRFGGTAVSGYPDDLSGFGTNTSIWLVWDAASGSSGIGESTNSATLEFLVGGSAFAPDALQFQITDIDSTDNNNTSDRCDFVTVTGNAGNPALSYIHPTASQRSVRIGVQAGSGATGTLAANQAQCIYNTGTTTSPTSNADDFGSVLATFPANTHTATVAYDESIENIYGVTSRNAAARGIGVWGGSAVVVNTSVTLAKTASVPVYTAAGQVVTYTYVVTNTGRLPINTGQNIQIQDDKIGTFACGSITSPVSTGGTVSCTANYTVTAADLVAPNVTNNAVAGVGTGTQSFATRLQSNTAQAVVTNSAIVAVDDNFSGSPLSGTFGGTTATVFGNDTLAGVSFAPSAVIVSIVSDGGLTGVAINADGTLTVPGSTTSGTYAVTYRICQASIPANCDDAVATVAVSVAPPSGGTSCTGTNLAANFGFETPNYTGGPSVYQAPEALVDFWSTTDTSIEIWQSGFNGVASHTGDQHAELNANIAGTLTQEVPGVASRAEVKVFWAHRARSGNDTASLAITDNAGGSTAYGNFTTSTAAWVVRSTTHVASPGASSVDVSFTAVSTGSGNISVGNFLDTVEVCQTYLTLSKTHTATSDADGSGGDTAGDVLTYGYAVSNPAGNESSVAGAQVVDDRIGTISFSSPISGDANANGFLDPGETWTVQANYTLTQADLDAEAVTNIARAEGSTASGSLRSDDDTVTVPLTGAPALAVTKTASAPGFVTGDVLEAPAGTVVTYTYVVTNTGNQTITSIALSENHNGSGPAPVPGGEVIANDVAPLADSIDASASDGVWSSLAPGDSVAFTGVYTITQNDVDILQ